MPELEPSPPAVVLLVSIWSLRPSTSPSALSSGPPEFPGLIGASVWIAPGIVQPFGAVIERPVWLTMPEVTVSGRLNGLPIATTSSPTCAVDESANVSGCSSEAGASTLITPTSVDGSVPTSFADAT